MRPVRYPTSSPLGVLGPFSDHPVEFLVRAEALGAPVVRSWLGPFPQWFVFDADLGREVLQQLDRDFNRPPYLRHLIGAATGSTLFTTVGEEWRQRRRMLQPEFHRSRVRELASLMVDVIDAELSSWAVDRPVDVQEAMGALAMRVAGRALFGTEIGAVERSDLATSFSIVSEWLTDRFANPRALPAPIPTRTNRAFHAARDTLREFVRSLIRERRTEPSGAYDVLQILLDARLESGGPLSDDDIVAESLGFLFAGHETTASALTWSIYELARHPTIADAIRAEGNESDTLRRVIRETLRLHPPAWGIPRTATRTTTIGPYRIRRGVGVIVSTYTINRSRRYWDEPETFWPDRFVPGNDRPRPTYLPLAFGAGPRMCIGQAFAELETQLVLARAIDRYDFEANMPTSPTFSAQFSLHIDGGLQLILRRRQPTHA